MRQVFVAADLRGLYSTRIHMGLPAEFQSKQASKQGSTFGDEQKLQHVFQEQQRRELSKSWSRQAHVFSQQKKDGVWMPIYVSSKGGRETHDWTQAMGQICALGNSENKIISTSH